MIYNVPVFFNGKNEGEKKVHEKLINLFEGKKYFALHSVKLPNHETKLNGECDFILITDRGILCLEVKGSSSVKRINKIDRTDGTLDKDLWIYDTYSADESPFEQAEGAIYPLKKMLAEDNLSRRNKFVIGHGVIFTEIEFNEKLKKKGIILRSTEDGYKIKNMLRLTIGSKKENLKFMKATESIFQI